MSRDDLLEFLRIRPFQPFRIHLTNGTVYEVRHPELVLVGRTRAMVFFPAPDAPPPAFDRFEALALVHITRIEPLMPTAAA